MSFRRLIATDSCLLGPGYNQNSSRSSCLQTHGANNVSVRWQFDRHAPPEHGRFGILPISYAEPPHWPIDGWRGDVKRVCDIVFALLALVVLSIPMLLIALAIRLESPGPTLFRQRRIGFANVGFEMWKFRTMCHHPSEPGRLTQATRHDKRVTRWVPSCGALRSMNCRSSSMFCAATCR